VKKTLLITLVALSCYSVRAQGRVEFGLKGGINIANLSDAGQQVYDYSPRASLNGGALLNIKFSNGFSGFSLQPEAVFSGQGGIYGFNGHNYTTHLTYLNFPILLQYQFRDGFRLETGPQFGVLLSARETGYGDNNNNVSSDYKSTDFSWAFGGAFMSRRGLGIDARFNVGIYDINNDPAPNNANINNGVFQVGLFYQFGHWYSRY
jgi:hypothetical protein